MNTHTHTQDVQRSLSELGATRVLQYTSDVQGIIDDVNENLPSEVKKCCDYEFQLLDQYCATRTPVSFHSLNLSDSTHCEQHVVFCEVTADLHDDAQWHHS